MIKTIADTIIWIAESRIAQGQKYSNKVGAVCSIIMEVFHELLPYFKDHKGEGK